MAKITIYTKGRFKVVKNAHGYIVINTQGDYDSHSHFKNLEGAKRVLHLIEKHILPNSEWWKEAIRRLVGEEELSTYQPNKRQAYYNCTTHISQRRR